MLPAQCRAYASLADPIPLVGAYDSASAAGDIMTVIAFKHRRMACDSLCADAISGSIWYKANKIHRTKSGALIGCSGAADARAMLALLDNVKHGHQMPNTSQIAATRVESQNGILIALPSGELWCITSVLCSETKEWHSDCCQITGMGGMAVAGCGGEVAMAAMRSGKSAREAVAIACEMNAFCRPPIHEELLDPVTKPLTRSRK